MERVPFPTVLVGQNTLLREGLARVLSDAKFRILASAPCADDAVLSTLPLGERLLLIIDVSDDFNAAVGQIQRFKEHYPTGRIAVLAQQHQLSKMVLAFRAGAHGYFVNVATCEAFIKSLELVMLGETVLPPAVLAFLCDDPGDRNDDDQAGREEDEKDSEGDHAEDDDNKNYDDGADPAADVLPETNGSRTPRLSDRQKAILRCLIEGNSNKAIARKINISEATVKVHVKAILRKLSVQNRTQAAIWGMNNGPFISSPGRMKASLAVTQVLSSEHKNVPASSPALKVGGANYVALHSIDRLVRKGD